MYPHQAERLAEVLQRADLDGLVATSAENIAYISGFRRIGGGVAEAPAFGIFTRAGTALVVPAVEVVSVLADAGDVDHIVCFGGWSASPPDTEANAETRRIESILAEAASSPVEALAVALDRLGVGQGSIGVDESRLTPEVWERVRTRLSDLKVATAAGHLAAARRVKGPYEIECLGHALRIAEQALDAVIQAIDRGMTEREVAALFAAEVVKLGGWPWPPVVVIGERTGIPASWPTDHALRTGNLVRFDVGCTYKGYCSSVGRTAVLGQPSAQQDALGRAVQTGLEAAIAAITTGASGGHVFQAMVEALRAQGLSPDRTDHVGHGIGLEPREDPVLSSRSATTLELGEVLSIEASHYQSGSMGVSATDTVLVTTAGARVLNRSHHGLVVLD